MESNACTLHPLVSSHIVIKGERTESELRSVQMAKSKNKSNAIHLTYLYDCVLQQEIQLFN